MTRTAVALAALSWLLIPPSPANAADWAAVVQRTAPAIVNLKITVRSESESGGEPEESTQEVQGALVDPSGLVLVWNSHFSANRFLDLLAEMGGGTHVSMHMTGEAGGFFKLAEGMVQKELDKSIGQDLSKLKALLEG